jgi:hypothetical protein
MFEFLCVMAGTLDHMIISNPILRCPSRRCLQQQQQQQRPTVKNIGT